MLNKNCRLFGYLKSETPGVTNAAGVIVVCGSCPKKLEKVYTLSADRESTIPFTFHLCINAAGNL
jgi:hypothetical protein